MTPAQLNTTRLFFNGQRSNKSSNVFGSLRQLTQTFLTSAHGCVNNLKKKLTSTRIEDENGSVDGFGSQVAFKGLVDRDMVDVFIVDEPNDLIGEQCSVILRRQVWFRWLILLKTLAGAFKQDVKSRISLHDFHHGLLNKPFGSRKPAAVSTMQIIENPKR